MDPRPGRAVLPDPLGPADAGRPTARHLGLPRGRLAGLDGGQGGDPAMVASPNGSSSPAATASPWAACSPCPGTTARRSPARSRDTAWPSAVSPSAASSPGHRMLRDGIRFLGLPTPADPASTILMVNVAYFGLVGGRPLRPATPARAAVPPAGVPGEDQLRKSRLIMTFFTGLSTAST